MSFRKATALPLASLAAVAGLTGAASTGNTASNLTTRSTTHSSTAHSAAVPLSAGDNNGAGVGGVTGVKPNSGCPSGYFCLYTGPDYTGTEFQLHHCVEYDLYNWNGVGSWLNQNTGGTHALIQDWNYDTLSDTDPTDYWYSSSHDFSPAWHVKPC